MNLDSYQRPIVHIVTDEKFISAAYSVYEKAFPGSNRIVVLLQPDQKQLVHLPAELECDLIKVAENFLTSVARIVGKAEIVVFHGMSFHQSQIALHLDKKDKKFIWALFGFEVYSNHFLFDRNIYGKETYKKFIFSLDMWIKNRLRKYYYLLFKKVSEPDLIALHAFEKMDYLSVLYKEEFYSIKNKLSFTANLKHLPFTYYPLELIIQNDMIKGENILIGNSASFTNNHLEIFQLLSKFQTGDRRIIVPLSYGNKNYASAIIEKGTLVFGNSFKPLIDFLPLSDYQNILRSCSIVIMNHYRQQAVGNVLNAMYMGAKVYLSRRNTLYLYLKRIGCCVFSIEDDLLPENKNVFDQLTQEQMEKNRKILYQELNIDRICNELRNKLSL